MTLDENPGPRHLNPGPRHLKNKPGPLTPPSPPAPLPPPPSSPRCPAGELQQLQNVKQQRLDAANRRKHGIYEVYRYVENSRQDFRGTVLGPILLEIGSIARPQVAAFLEQAVGDKLLNFVCSDRCGGRAGGGWSRRGGGQVGGGGMKGSREGRFTG